MLSALLMIEIKGVRHASSV